MWRVRLLRQLRQTEEDDDKKEGKAENDDKASKATILPSFCYVNV